MYLTLSKNGDHTDINSISHTLDFLESENFLCIFWCQHNELGLQIILLKPRIRSWKKKLKLDEKNEVISDIYNMSYNFKIYFSNNCNAI